MRIRASFIVFALLVSACGAPSPTGGSETLDGAWELRSAVVDGSRVALLDDHRVTATITGDEFGGRAACNSYGGTMEVDDDEVSFQDMGWTEMACEAAVMEVEQAYINALMRVTTAQRSGSTLVFGGPGVDLEFALLAPAPTTELVGVTWMLSEIVQGDAVTSPAEGADDPAEPAMLVLNADGTLSGHTGCRELSGEYIVAGDEIVFTSFSADGDCIPELQWQDGQVITVLEGGFTAEIVGSRLTVKSTGGEGLVFRAGP